MGKKPDEKGENGVKAVPARAYDAAGENFRQCAAEFPSVRK